MCVLNECGKSSEGNGVRRQYRKNTPREKKRAKKEAESAVSEHKLQRGASALGFEAVLQQRNDDDDDDEEDEDEDDGGGGRGGGGSIGFVGVLGVKCLELDFVQRGSQ